MRRLVLLAFAVIAVAAGSLAFSAPRTFYGIVPGLAAMGPFNLHFVRDVGLAFIASGGALGWGAWRRHRAVAIAGASWLALHGTFHLWIQALRGFPSDLPMWFDLAGVVFPSFVTIVLASTMDEHGSNQS